MADIFYRAATSGFGTSGGAQTLNVPTGTLSNDVMVCVTGSTSTASIPNYTWPAGWTVAYINNMNLSSVMGCYAHVEIAVKQNAGESTFSVTYQSSMLSGTYSYSISSYGGVYDGTTTNGLIANSGISNGNTFISSINSPSVSSSNSGLWKLGASYCVYTQPRTFTAGSDTVRAQAGPTSNPNKICSAIADSNSVVDASGGVHSSFTLSGASYGVGAWVGLLNPSPARAAGSELYVQGQDNVSVLRASAW